MLISRKKPAKFAILLRKLHKSMFFGEPPHTSHGQIGTPLLRLIPMDNAVKT